LAPAGHRHPQP